MNKNFLKHQALLNHKDKAKRIENLKILTGQYHFKKPIKHGVNNHIHTTYSFSPYSPAMATWMAKTAGLNTAGIMDHDTISGAAEFIQAGEIINLKTTAGVECRVDFSKTVLNGRYINNPDQQSIAYVALHAIPHTQFEKINNFFRPYNVERNKRNKLMLERLNQLIKSYDMQLDFNKHIIPQSMFAAGGVITERHLLFALCRKIKKQITNKNLLIKFLRQDLKVDVNKKDEHYLRLENNIFFEFDLLNILKRSMVEHFYIKATAECADVKDIIALAETTGSIPAYAYLGDIDISATGDKKKHKFEDDYLELLFEVINKLGFKAVTYMPTRNTVDQLKKVRKLCRQYSMLEIHGEDINSPRQEFICQVLKNEKYSNLINTAWVLIGHEQQATDNLAKGFFSREIIARYPDLNQRIEVFKIFGKSTNINGDNK